MVYRSAIFLFFIFLFLFHSNIYAQEKELQESPEEITAPSDTTTVSDTISSQRKSDIETTIVYDARDSIIMSLDNTIILLYGQAHIKYGQIELEAAHIIIDYTNQTLFATGAKDTLGRDINMPIFKNGQEVYETREITYNFKTGKARISEVVTKQGEGFLHGKTVFKNPQNELFSIDNTYTTCNLPHPHYRIRSRKTKAIPDDKIISGLFNLEINDVPLPLGFPFGFFPAQREAASGIIIPSYGEEKRRGFFLRGGGYFFDISDYVKTWIEGDIYSKGGHALYLNTQYQKRYAYTGSFNFSYTQLRATEDIEEGRIANDYRLRWQHTPISKGNSRFSAQINAATATFTENNFIGMDENLAAGSITQLSRELSSSVSYTKKFGNSPFNLGVSARHNQDLFDRDVSISLPELSFTMNNVYPFQGMSDFELLDRLQVRYSMNGTNQINNIIRRVDQPDSIAPFNLENLPTFIENAKNGIRHAIPLTTSFNLLKFLAVSPSINYNERWYFDKLVWGINDSTQKPFVLDTLQEFNRVYDYNISTGINTRLYGTYFFKQGRVRAIRHVMNPSLSFSYHPDFSDSKYGFYQGLVNESGNTFIRSRHQGFVYGGAPMGESGSIGLSLNNTLEMKVQSNDSVQSVQKVSILNNFGISTAYNVLADSFQLSAISLRANTTLFKNKINLSLTGSIDPYEYRIDNIRTGRDDELIYDQTRIDRLAFRTGGGLGTLSQLNFAISTNINPKANTREQEIRERIRNSNLPEAEKEFALRNAEDYVDFSIPWNLRINYTLSFNKKGLAPREVSGNAVTFSGNLSLTEKWKVTFSSGYNLKNKDFTLTRFGITRDLHCWTMDFNWTPFGNFTSYDFTIRVKSALLQDLKLNRRRSFIDNVN
ncbi:MAG: putative LPS assembly protein LptD [Candidatus Cyclobacteriaceae bacterium M2_1C_046]